MKLTDTDWSVRVSTLHTGEYEFCPESKEAVLAENVYNDQSRMRRFFTCGDKKSESITGKHSESAGEMVLE